MVSIEVLTVSAIVLMVILFPIVLLAMMVLVYDESANQPPENSG